MLQYDTRAVRNFCLAEAKRRAQKHRSSFAGQQFTSSIEKSGDQIPLGLEDFREAQAQDPGFQLRTTFSENNQIQSICWQSSIQRILALQHHDVIWVDTTFCTNVYDRPLLQICMLDENGHTRSVFAALMNDSSSSCWNWAITQFIGMSKLDTTVQRTFILDQESAMEAAIKANFQNIHIVSCWYHINVGIRRSLVAQGIARDAPRLNLFNSLLNRAYYAPTEAAFHSAINELSIEFPTMRSKLTTLATKSAHWAQYSVRELFTCGKITTQVVEGAHFQLKTTLNRRSTKRDSLNTLIKRTLELVNQQRALSAKYRSPLIANVDTKTSKAWSAVFCNIQRECVQYFGSFIHAELKNAIADAALFIAKKLSTDDIAQTCVDICGRQLARICLLPNATVFQIRERSQPKPSTVLVVNDHQYECSCIESVQRGILCAHFLAVYADCENDVGFNRCMIKFRWVLPAKRRQHFIGVQTFKSTSKEGCDLPAEHVQSMRLRAFHAQGVITTSSSEVSVEPISANTLHKAQLVLQTALAMLPQSSEANGDLLVQAGEKWVRNMQIDKARNSGALTTYSDGTASIDTREEQHEDLSVLQMPSKSKGGKPVRSKRPYKLAEKGTKVPFGQKRKGEESQAKQKRAKLKTHNPSEEVADKT